MGKYNTVVRLRDAGGREVMFVTEGVTKRRREVTGATDDHIRFDNPPSPDKAPTAGPLVMAALSDLG
jgi:hypothetical protein